MTRKYELKKRAEHQAATRQRIVEAAVELHRTVGPARTTVSAIAELAGVERKTFYRHFPDADEVLKACSAHYRALHPPPDPETWRTIQDPAQRLRHALLDLYAYYRSNEQMMSNVLRDRQLGLPVGDGFLRHRAAAKLALAQTFAGAEAARRLLEASLEVALDFHVWQLLAGVPLSDPQAAELMAGFIRNCLETPQEQGPNEVFEAPDTASDALSSSARPGALDWGRFDSAQG